MHHSFSWAVMLKLQRGHDRVAVSVELGIPTVNYRNIGGMSFGFTLYLQARCFEDIAAASAHAGAPEETGC